MKSVAGTRLWSLSSVPFVMVLSNSLLIPVLPAMQRGMHLSAFQAGLIITAFSVPAGLTIPVGGILSDRAGRKTVIVPALFLFGLGGLLAGLAPLVLQTPFPAILGARVLQGIGGGGLYQIAMALAGDLFQSAERSKVLGILEASNGLGKVVAPILGAAVALIAWHAPFFAYPVLAWGAALAVWRFVREPRRAQRPKPALHEYVLELKSTWRGRGVSLLAAFAAGMVVLLVLFGILSYYSDILESRWGIRGFAKGFVMAVPVLAMAVTSYVTGILLQKRLAGIGKWVVAGGLVLSGAALGASLLLKGLVGFSAAIAVLGLGSGLVLPAVNSLVTGAVGSEARGIVTSLYGTVRFFGAAFGPPAAGRLAAGGAAPVLLGAAGAALGAAAVVAFLLRQDALTAGKGGRAETRRGAA